MPYVARLLRIKKKPNKPSVFGLKENDGHSYKDM